MLVKVWLPNNTHVIMEENKVDEFFPEDADIEIEDFDDTESEAKDIQRHNQQFKSLVGSLDAKFASTYEANEESLVSEVNGLIKRLEEELK